jgi:hypothetical protein
VVIGTSLPVTVLTTFTNNGPSAPIDVTVTRTATASAGSSIAPSSITSQVSALKKGDVRQVRDTYTITCSAPGVHTFAVTADIEPLHAVDVDPDTSNNRNQTSLSVDCIVPVAINIKPKSYPNAFNLGSSGGVPVAVLTTRAGEYQLPLAFDATQIDPETVLFGAHDLVFRESGGAHATNSHLEDSYELDEKTKDGDTDMLLQFPTAGTGLTASDTQACVKGQFLAANGNRYKFFGCDSAAITK